MSPHAIERSAWNATKWLWLLLALSLIAWRVSSRTEQYHWSIAAPVQQAQVAFFDANERNTSTLDAAQPGSVRTSEPADRLFPAAAVEPPMASAGERPRESRRTLPPIYVDSVSLFSNPPPASLL